MDIWELIQKANEICGILSLLVSVFALFKVSDVQKQIRKQMSSKDQWNQNAKATGGSWIEQNQTGGQKQ